MFENNMRRKLLLWIYTHLLSNIHIPLFLPFMRERPKEGRLQCISNAYLFQCYVCVCVRACVCVCVCVCVIERETAMSVCTGKCGS